MACLQYTGFKDVYFFILFCGEEGLRVDLSIKISTTTTEMQKIIERENLFCCCLFLLSTTGIIEYIFTHVKC